MTVLEQVTAGLSRGRQEYDRIMEQITTDDDHNADQSLYHIPEGSVLAHADNLEFTMSLLKEG